MIRFLAHRLGPLREMVVFLGGATTGLFITDDAAPEARFTQDVDVIIEVASTVDYWHLEETLREKGFTQRMLPGDPICRWTIEGALIDVMPTFEEILGFSNRWYPQAVTTAERRGLADVEVRVVSPVYFLATKLVAFQNRGNNDYFASRDMEDIVAVIDGRKEITGEAEAAPE